MQMMTLKLRRPWMVTGSLCVLSLLVGCKTDGLSSRVDRYEDESAPVANLENPGGVDLPAIPIADISEIDLVEQLMYHRAMYARYLRAVETYYREHGYEHKANWARNELNDLRRVKPYRYLDDAIVPPASLRPTQSIAEADALFDEGLALMKRAGHGTPVFYNQDTMKLALAKFKDLIDRFPNSDKIDDAAFMIGEIHKEYFEEEDNEIAIKWYQRALEWNPNTPYPVRFQMAVVYDYRMHEREKALDMYQQVIEHETFNQSNVDFANVRIGRLTREETRLAPGDSMPPQSNIPAEPGPAEMPG